MEIAMKVELFDVAKLVPYARNPRIPGCWRLGERRRAKEA